MMGVTVARLLLVVEKQCHLLFFFLQNITN